MSLITIKPIRIGKFVPIPYINYVKQLYNWLKNNDGYHDVFSNAIKWKYLFNFYSKHYNIETAKYFHLISKEFPQQINNCYKEYLTFMFEGGYFNFLDSTIEFDINLWNKYIKDSKCPTIAMAKFSSEWLEKYKCIPELKHLLIDELQSNWRNLLFKTKKRHLIALYITFGNPMDYDIPFLLEH